MTTFQADSSNFADLLQMVRDGFEINLASGEYKGPFTIDKSITIRGSGPETIIFAENQPALTITVAGVRLENLAIERIVGGNTGEVAIFAKPNTTPTLSQVRLTGVAENVEWEGASWDIPTILEFGEVETNRQVERLWEIELGSACEVVSDVSWLQLRSNYLSPGLQNLDVVLNSADIPAGTNLSGLIFLLAADARREMEIISISAKIIAAQTTHSGSIYLNSLESEETDSEISSEDWGYDLWRKAAENLIRDVEGKAAVEKYSEYDIRPRASTLISEILGSESILFYLRNKGEGQNQGEQKLELTIATDRNDISLPPMLEERNKTLSLLAVVSEDGYGGLKLLSARLQSQEQGREDGFAQTYYISLRPERQWRRGVPESAVQRIREMPVVGERVPTEEQLRVWKAFLNIEENIAKSRQFCVPFYNHNYGAATRKITFEVEYNNATVEPTSGKFLTNNDFWERAKKARNEEIKLLEIEPNTNGEQVEYLLGNVEEINEQGKTIRVRLDSELVEKINQGNYQLPKRGFLSFEAAGDLIQIRRKRRALDDLNKGKTQNPYLGEFFFDASKARDSRKYIKLEREKLLLPTANNEQISAVEKVLTAPDLVLIQGPPGTGKTTVIAEICYQIALRGGKTLIASQANLAVDNALSRLVHSPVIRALRKGRAERVEAEGLPFLEDKVIGTWLENTADYCEGNLTGRLKNIELFNKFLPSLKRFEHYINLELEIANLERVKKLGVKPKQYNVFLQEVQEKRKWWQKIWQRIPENIRPAVADSELFNIEFLEGM
ncbi:MAG: AAA domain-containing protein, partial [Microcoleaceae cyanobacterium]